MRADSPEGRELLGALERAHIHRIGLFEVLSLYRRDLDRLDHVSLRWHGGADVDWYEPLVMLDASRERLRERINVYFFACQTADGRAERASRACEEALGPRPWILARLASDAER